MAARTRYPVPPCPKCGWKTNKVKNTYYTEDGRILRYRECHDCEWRWWTLQYPEQILDISKFMVRIPKWKSSDYTRKQIKIVAVDELY